MMIVYEEDLLSSCEIDVYIVALKIMDGYCGNNPPLCDSEKVLKSIAKKEVLTLDDDERARLIRASKSVISYILTSLGYVKGN